LCGSVVLRFGGPRFRAAICRASASLAVVHPEAWLFICHAELVEASLPFLADSRPLIPEHRSPPPAISSWNQIASWLLQINDLRKTQTKLPQAA
jgi:hypothetical protein